MPTKVCSKCKQSLPATTEFFHKRSDGLRGVCKECSKEKRIAKDKRYYERNKDRLLQKRRENYNKNKEQINAQRRAKYPENRERICEQNKKFRDSHKQYDSDRNKKWRAENKDYVKQKQKQYYVENKESFLEYAKEFREKNRDKIAFSKRRYYENNKENILEYGRIRYCENKEKISEYKKEYRRKYPEKARIQNHKRKARILKLPATLTEKQWKECLEHFDYKCAFCGQEKPLAQEHFVAVTKGGGYTRDNIIPSCESCNSSKFNRNFFDWYPRQDFYSKQREQKILKYLGYNKQKQQLSLF